MSYYTEDYFPELYHGKPKHDKKEPANHAYLTLNAFLYSTAEKYELESAVTERFSPHHSKAPNKAIEDESSQFTLPGSPKYRSSTPEVLASPATFLATHSYTPLSFSMVRWIINVPSSNTR